MVALEVYRENLRWHLKVYRSGLESEKSLAAREVKVEIEKG